MSISSLISRSEALTDPVAEPFFRYSSLVLARTFSNTALLWSSRPFVLYGSSSLMQTGAGRGRERRADRRTYVCTTIHPTCGPFKSKYKHTCTRMDNTHTHTERKERTIGACCTFLCTNYTAEQMYAHAQQQ